jgi:multimeric flavodoxin WrbA
MSPRSKHRIRPDPADLANFLDGDFTIVGIFGSPNGGGTAEHLLDQALRIATERGFRAERLISSELEVGFCTDCGNCRQGMPCPVEDDTARVRETLAAASGIIIASPVRFGNVTSQHKALFDRTLLLRKQGFLLKNKARCAIAVGWSRNGGQETARAAALKLCDVLDLMQKRQGPCWIG